MPPVNVVIVGNGHYVSGQTPLAGIRTTDKDLGVLLPSVLQLRREGLVGEVAIVGRDGDKADATQQRFEALAPGLGWDGTLSAYPAPGTTDDLAYAQVLADEPRPCVALIAVPDMLHEPVIMECIRQDIPFLVVKPAVVDLDSLYRILDAMDERGVFGMVDYHKVFDQMNILLKAEYRAGEYGRLYHAHSLMTQRRDMLSVYERWLKTDPTLNVNHYLGSHYAHLVGFITGAEPLDVRATAQGTVAAELVGRPIADLIEMQVRWKAPPGEEFVSYHVSGWSDPSETESMTYQELHLLCENGHVDSDQRDRGFKKVLSGAGPAVPNPYFFNLAGGGPGGCDLSTQYGYRSVKAFVSAATEVLAGTASAADFDGGLPTLRDSETVTAILEAADLSLAQGSSVVGIGRADDRYVLE